MDGVAPSRSSRVRAGLVLAVVLALTDLAIVLPYVGGGPDRPPLAVVSISVVLGLVGLVAAVAAWRTWSRTAFVVVLVTRVVSALGDLLGLGEDTAVLVASLVLLVVSLLCLWMLWPAVSRRGTAPRPGVA